MDKKKKNNKQTTRSKNYKNNNITKKSTSTNKKVNKHNVNKEIKEEIIIEPKIEQQIEVVPETQIEEKPKKKLKLRKEVYIVLFIILLFILTFGLYNIIKWKLDSNSTKEQIEEIQKITDVIEVEDNDKTIIIENNEEKNNYYWDFIKMKLIDVNFNELKKINGDTVGWIQVSGTNINYPFVQTDNNDFYLNHSFNKKRNSAGWVFLDYRNNLSKEQKNTIIYAHGRLDTTMFGSLKNALTDGWLDEPHNHVVKLSTEYENSLWQVFSIYRIPTTNDYLKIDFGNNLEFNKFTEMLIDRSEHDFDTKVIGTDRILTLSTCLNNETKVVLHAKLIKVEKRD